MAAPLILAESSLARRDRRAFTLTELSIVLGVIGLVLGGIWVAAGQAYNAQKATKAAGQVQQILAGYRKMFGNRRVDTGAGVMVNVTQIGINAGYFPSDMVDGGVVTSPWGNPVVVWGLQDSNGIFISYYSIPQSACIALASSEANAPNIIESFVGLSGTAPHPVYYPASPPMTSDQINTYCADSPTNNEVSFEYSMN